MRMLAIVLVAACATGAPPLHNTGDDDVALDAQGKPDAPAVTTDASPPIDGAPPPIDAFVPPPADAAVPMPDAPASLFCSANTECTVSGQCCIRLGGPMGFCGDGIPIGSECIPQ